MKNRIRLVSENLIYHVSCCRRLRKCLIENNIGPRYPGNNGVIELDPFRALFSQEWIRAGEEADFSQ